MSSIMRRRRGLKSAISILLSEGGGLQHPHPLSQEAIYATLPLTPRAAASFNPLRLAFWGTGSSKPSRGNSENKKLARTPIFAGYRGRSARLLHARFVRRELIARRAEFAGHHH